MRFAKTRLKAGGFRGARLNVGFVPTVDCATLIAAQELGLFAQQGLKVRLSREVGWATIREKILHEELDAAATHGSMLFSIYCGIGVVRRPCLTGLMMSANGSAITLSNELWDLGVRDAATLARAIKARSANRPLVFGVVLEYSSQHYNLRNWLEAGGVDPKTDVRIVVIPSALMYETFKAGFLDGYCVAEPWNSTAVLDKTGWVVATTNELAPEHPDKVFLVLQDFAETREEEHLRMIAALIEASEFCEAKEHRRELASMLAQPQYFNLDPKYLFNALLDPFERGKGLPAKANIVGFHAGGIGAPNRGRARWIYDLVRNLCVDPLPVLHPDTIGKVFRHDIYEKAHSYLRTRNAKPSAEPVSKAQIQVEIPSRKQGSVARRGARGRDESEDRHRPWAESWTAPSLSPHAMQTTQLAIP